MDNLLLRRLTVGGGCFWCTEAVFRAIKGVHSVTSGYSGGSIDQPTYKQVCSGTTGHAEAVQIEFDPQVTNMEALLDVFFRTHDPTTLNRQGADAGTQYRSVVFYENADELATIQRVINELTTARVFARPIVTTCEEYRHFWPAEADHQAFFERNPWQPYCMAVIRPKMDKFREQFADQLRDE